MRRQHTERNEAWEVFLSKDPADRGAAVVLEIADRFGSAKIRLNPSEAEQLSRALMIESRTIKRSL